MEKFSRKWEKICAWISNVIMILVTLIFSLAVFTGAMKEVFNSKEFKMSFEEGLRSSGNPAALGYNVDTLAATIIDVMNAYTIFLIILTVFAIISSFLMKKRILAGVSFLILAIITFIATVGFLFPVSILYLIVAIMLFVRKPKDDFNNFSNNNLDNKDVEVDKIEYV